jgi:hypothetical protein
MVVCFGNVTPNPQAVFDLGISNKIFIHALTGLYRSQSRIAGVHCKKRFPFSPAGMSLIKLFLAGNY